MRSPHDKTISERFTICNMERPESPTGNIRHESVYNVLGQMEAYGNGTQNLLFLICQERSTKLQT